MKPIKILELKGEDFSKGLSYFTDFSYGGWFSQAGFYPLEDYGYFTPPLEGVVTDSSLTSTPKFITTWNDSGTARLYVHTNDKLYQVLDSSPYTTVNKSTEIDVASPVGGVAVFKNKYIYNQPAVSKVFSNAFPVASGSNVEILSTAGSSEFYRPMCVAPDKNLYVGDFGQINQITSVTGTTGNTVTYYQIESGFIVRDMISDGQYLIVIADNNLSHKISTTGNSGSFRCLVLFYDVNNGRPTADYIHEFTDSYLSAVKIVDGQIYVFGKDNLWICNSITKPKAVFSFQTGSTITEPPRYFFEITQKNNTLLWCGQTNQKIYGFGNKISGQKKIFMQPYAVGSTAKCIGISGEKIYVGTNGTNQMLYVLNTGTTRVESTLATTNIVLPNPFTFAFAKIILKNKLTSGGSVGFGLSSQNNQAKISDFATKTYAQIGAKQSILFSPTIDAANNVKIFQEIVLTATTNRAIERIEVWGYPVENYEQSV